MAHALSDHHDKILATLRALDPVQVRLSQRVATPTPSALAQLAHTLAAALRRWHRRRVTIQALKALPDYVLADIGVRRGEIRAVVRRLSREQGQVGAQLAA